MSDENHLGLMDSEQRQDAAMEQLGGSASDSETPQGEPQDRVGEALAQFEVSHIPEQQVAPPAGDVAAVLPAPAASGPGASSQDAAPGMSPEAATLHKALEPVFAKYGIGNASEAEARLADAALLYEIAEGKSSPAKLLNELASNGKWNSTQVGEVAHGLIAWLSERGFLTGPAPNQGTAAEKEGGPETSGSAGTAPPVVEKTGVAPDSLEQRVAAIERDRQASAERQAQAAKVLEERRVYDVFNSKIKDLCSANQIPAEDAEIYAQHVSGLVAGNREVLDRIAKGNFVDVQKFFAQIHHREIQRLQRWTNQQTRSKQARQDNAPRSPAGGAPPAPAGKMRRDLKSFEGRTSAALAEYDR